MQHGPALKHRALEVRKLRSGAINEAEGVFDCTHSAIGVKDDY